MMAMKAGIISLGARSAGLFAWFVTALALSPGVEARASDAVVVALGASNTAGKGVNPEEAYPTQLAAMLHAKGLLARVINAGINGDTTSGMLARLDADVPDGTRVVILQPGGNDRRRGGAGEREHNIGAIMARLRSRHIAVVLLENAMLHAIPDAMRQSDGQHFTPEGYRLLAARLLPRVIAALRR